MNKTGLILFHGFFEHKERHRLNAEWFENLGINTHLVDLPGHGEGAVAVSYTHLTLPTKP